MTALNGVRSWQLLELRWRDLGEDYGALTVGGELARLYSGERVVAPT